MSCPSVMGWGFYEVIRIFSTKLIPLYTRVWRDSRDRNILIWRWYSSNIVLMFFRALQRNLPLSFSNTTKLFLWFWITVKAFFLYATLETIKFCHADLTCPPLTLFKEPGTTLQVCQGHSYVIICVWNCMFATICHIDTLWHDFTKIMSVLYLSASSHIFTQLLLLIISPLSSTDLL